MQGVASSVREVTRFLGVPDYDIESPAGHGVYTWYNSWQRDKNHYLPMKAQTRALLDFVFCEPNRDLESLLRSLEGSNGKGPLLPSHGYACVE